jgi:hypothetical protein
VTLAPRGGARAIALLAPGGRSAGDLPARALAGTALRMYPFLVDLRRAGGRRGLLVAQLRYRAVGWNDGAATDDVRWAIERLRARDPDAPVCLVGHSMGARACLRAADAAGVVGVAGLAAWLPADEPVAPAAGRTVMLAHGVRDRVTDPAGSLRFARDAHPLAARLCRFEIAGARHAMLDRPLLWHALVRAFVLGAVGLRPFDRRLAEGFALAAPEAIRIAI